MATPAAAAALEKEKGNEFYKNKDYDEAVAAYGRAIELDPQSEVAALCYSNRSAVFQVQKKFAKAEKDARSCLEIKPDFVKGYIRLALAQRKQGKFEDAATTINDGLKRAPDDPDLKKAEGQVEKAKTKTQAKMAQAEMEEYRRKMQALQQETSQLQDRHSALRGKLAETSMQVRGLGRGKLRSQMTLGQLEELPEDTRTYRGVGKMFVYAPMAETKEFLATKIKETDAKIGQLKQKEDYYSQGVKGVEDEIRSLVGTMNAGAQK